MHSTFGQDLNRPLNLSSAWIAAGVFLAVLTALRLAVLFLSDLDLGGDEAQYWTWSLDLDFGYYSKPPVIAWLIRAATELCGHAPACIRLPSPLIHLATALMLGAVARRLYDDRAGIWTAVVYATLPAVSFSSGIVSTDVPLLFFWATALYALVRLLDERRIAWSVLLGVAIGLGAMSKYAMVYFALCALAYCAVHRDARWVLISRHIAVTTVIALLIFVPNMIWNAQAGWATVGHTADNANWSGLVLHWDKMGGFVGAQFGVFGPILFAALLLRAVVDRARWPAADRFLSFFAYPIIALIVVQALLSRAHANWAATAYIAATPLVVAWLIRRGRGWLTGSLALHVTVAAALYAAVLLPAPLASLVDRDPFAKLHGWGGFAAQIERRLEQENASVLLLDKRMIFASLAHKLYGKKVSLYMWDYDGHPGNHYEQFNRYDQKAAGRPVILLIRGDHQATIAARFDTVKPLGPARRTDAAGRETVYHLFRLDGYRGRGAK